MHVVGTVQSYKNPINLYNLFSEQTKKQKDDRFNVTNNKVTLKNGTTPTFRRKKSQECIVNLKLQ